MKIEEWIKNGFKHCYELFESNRDLALSLTKGLCTPYNHYQEGFVSGVIEQIKEKNL